MKGFFFIVFHWRKCNDGEDKGDAAENATEWCMATGSNEKDRKPLDKN